MDLSLFKDLERLSRTGNFSQAAAMGNISQPAFSRRIKTLEAWVGVSLVDRTRQPVKLTEAGTQMLEAGMQAVARVEQERGQILEAQSLPDKYMVTFAAQHSIGWRFYPAWQQELEEAFGPILSRLRADNLPGCLNDLKHGEVDFVIAYQSSGVRPAETFDRIVIGQDRLVPVCKPDASGRPLFRFDRSGFEMPYLRFGETAPISALLVPLFVKYGLSGRLRTVYENAMAGALRIKARAGDGVAWLPKSLVAPDLESGVLVPTGDARWTVPLDICLLRDPRRENRMTLALWEFLASRQDKPLLG